VLSLKKNERTFSFIKTYKSLQEILVNHELASLGDAYINFVYSLALSNRRGKPSGAKVKGKVLAEAIRKAGLREYLPSRMTSHMLADAAEALMVYAWLCNYITLEESIGTLEKNEDLIEALTQLLTTIKNRIKIS
jgi:Na+-transporting NADH:ubiquinone oxidoreductase subunit NqrF